MEERLKSESIEDNCSGKTPETAPLLLNTAARCANDDDDDDDDDADDVFFLQNEFTNEYIASKARAAQH